MLETLDYIGIVYIGSTPTFFNFNLEYFVEQRK